MLPTIVEIYMSVLVENKIENVKWSESPCLTVFKDFGFFYKWKSINLNF
jgi:hypothetical protein